MLTSDLNLSKNCKRIEILKCVLKERSLLLLLLLLLIYSVTSLSLLSIFNSLIVRMRKSEL